MAIDQEEIGAELSALADTIKRAYQEKDVELYLSAFDEAAIVSMPGSAPASGHEALREAFINRPDLPPGATFEVQPLEMEAMAPGWAYAFGTDILEFAGPANGEPVRQTMTFLVLIKKTHEGWKTFREVVSADQP